MINIFSFCFILVTNSDHEDPIPKDAAKYDCIIQKMPHPTAGQIEIFIVQIDDPGLFYFHWFKKKESLDVLMGRMGYCCFTPLTAFICQYVFALCCLSIL